MKMATSMAKGPGRSYAMIKNALNNWPFSLQQALETEANMQAVAFETRDFREGINAFIEKRAPKFVGR